MVDTNSLQISPKGVCVKTCFYKEGQYMHMICTLVSNGDVQIFKGSLYLPPIVAAVTRAHARLHGPNSLQVSGWFSSITHAVNSLGVGKLVSSVTSAVKSVTNHIPVIGPIVNAATNAANAPMHMVQQIATGHRIDQAALGALKTNLASIKEVAPYVTTVISFVPGIGTGVAGAIAAAAALAQGQSISDAMLAGVRGAIPGGALAQAAFDVSQAALSGKRIDQAAIAALPLSPTAKMALARSVDVAKQLAEGKRVDAAVVDAAQKMLPPAMQKAVQLGVALGKAKSLQDAARITAGTAVVIPPVGAPALAAFALAKSAVDTIETANKVKARVEQIVKYGTAVEKAAAAKQAPRIATAMQQKARVQATLASLAKSAKDGNKEAIAAQKTFGIVIAQHQALKTRAANVAQTTQGVPVTMITRDGRIVPVNAVQAGAKKVLNGAAAFDGTKLLPGAYRVGASYSFLPL